MHLSPIMHGVVVMSKTAQIAAIEAALVALRRAQKRRALARLSRRTGEGARRSDRALRLPSHVDRHPAGDQDREEDREVDHQCDGPVFGKYLIDRLAHVVRPD
jgi:hypothetical protein